MRHHDDARTRRVRQTLEVALGLVILGSLVAESWAASKRRPEAPLACTVCYVDSTAYAEPYVCFKYGRLVLLED